MLREAFIPPMFPFLISSSYLQSVNASNTFADQDNLCLPHGTTSIQLYHTPPNPSPFCISYLPSEITFQNFSSILKHHLCSEQWLVSQVASILNLILSNTHINHQSQSPNIIKQQSKTIFMLMLLIRRIQKKMSNRFHWQLGLSKQLWKYWNCHQQEQVSVLQKRFFFYQNCYNSWIKTKRKIYRKNLTNTKTSP